MINHKTEDIKRVVILNDYRLMGTGNKKTVCAYQTYFRLYKS